LESTEGDTNFIPLLLQSPGGFQASNITILLIIILILLLMSAVIAGAETAYFSLTTKDINFLKGKEKGSARQAVMMLEQPKLLLATMLVANNFINISIVISTNYLVTLVIPGMHGYVAFIVNVICVTFILVLFGEVLPKVYATQNNLRLAVLTAPFIRVLLKFLCLRAGYWLVLHDL